MLESFFLYWSLESQFKFPPPTKAQSNLIARLGDSEWSEREKAVKELEELGDEGLSIYEIAASSADPEIAMRGQMLLSHFYHLGCDIPCIDGAYKLNVTLPSGLEIEVPKGLPKYYYDLARGGQEVENVDIKAMAIRATWELAKHLRRTGLSKEDVIAFLKEVKDKSLFTNDPYPSYVITPDKTEFANVNDFYVPLPWVPF